MRRRLIIVDRSRESLFELLRQAFAKQDDVEVIRDRRLRRYQSPGEGAPRRRRRVERRTRAEVDQLIDTVGWAELMLS
ncbi:MAG TPA: hypothetical protein VGL09_08960 [Methylomirabilota bacterium]